MIITAMMVYLFVVHGFVAFDSIVLTLALAFVADIVLAG